MILIIYLIGFICTYYLLRLIMYNQDNWGAVLVKIVLSIISWPGFVIYLTIWLINRDWTKIKSKPPKWL